MKIQEEEISLICLLGASPLVVTETIDVLQLQENKQIKGVHIVHTSHEIVTKHITSLTLAIKNRISQFAEIIFHPLPFVDILSIQEDNFFIQKLWDLIRTEKEKNNFVYVSIAGGRKTMSSSGALAANLAGADVILHVLLKNESPYTPVNGYPPSYEVPLHEIQLIQQPVINMFPLLGRTLYLRESGDLVFNGTNDLYKYLNDRIAFIDLQQQLRYEYESRRDKYERMITLVSTLVAALAGINNIRIEITSRVKTFDSILRKIEKDNISVVSAKSFFEQHQINDVAGVSLIFYYGEDMEAMLHIIRNSTDMHLIRESLKEKESGYAAVHLDLCFASARLEQAEYRYVKGIQCELQIRTALQQAWYKPNHWVFYKSKVFQQANETTRKLVEEKFLEAIRKINEAESDISAARKALEE